MNKRMSERSASAPLKKVNIRPGVSILSVLRHLNYKPWFALAEFVDNSVQSYLDNRATIEKLDGTEFRLRVRIDIETGAQPRISIKDNAAGIAREQFPRPLGQPRFQRIGLVSPSSAWG